MTTSTDDELHRRYWTALSPVFLSYAFDPLDYLAALLRMEGLEDSGWDPLHESMQTLRELTTLAQASLPAAKFVDPERTRLRLRLLAYAHLVEMDAPYDIIVNLCRLKAGIRPQMRAFAPGPTTPGKTARPSGKKGKPRPLNPTQKIDKIKAISKRAGVPELGTAFDEFYRASIRNAIDHSAYIIHEDEFRMHSTAYDHEEDRIVISADAVPLSDLNRVIDNAFAFYNVFFGLERSSREWFSRYTGKAVPYDKALKGLLEFLLDDEGLLCGFRVHWPNGTDSVYRRTVDGSVPLNVRYGQDGVGLFVGEYHQDHEPFSRLVERGSQPLYTPLEGSTEPLQWSEASPP